MNTLMMRYNRRKKKAVAPVLATLLMIAVAVAMSVIIFMWSQGFLAGTSESTGSQQGSQNQAAQSSIAIESATFDTSAGTVTVIIRNVGAVSVDLGNMIVTGISSNAPGYFASDITPLDTINLAKGVGKLQTSNPLPGLRPGDVITVKVTTAVGTFAQASYTVP